VQNSAQNVAIKWNKMTENIVKTNDKNCKNCGGSLKFCPEKQAVVCENCASVFGIEKISNIQKHDLDKNAVDQTAEYKDYVNQNKIFKCANCGSSVVLNVYDISKKCPYCSTNLVIDNDAIVGLKPDAILPFAFDSHKASEIFLEKVKKKWLVPKKFKNSNIETDIKGMYIPSFVYDCKTQSQYDGRLYNEYTETDSEGKTHTHREYFHISGSFNKNFDNILVESSSKINQSNIFQIGNYDFEKKVGYQDSYIRGFATEHYSESLASCTERYKGIVENRIRNLILRKHSYDGVDYLNVKTDFSDEHYSYYLVPVYRFNFEYKNKPYTSYMNGQTGNSDCKFPKSKVKIAFIVIFSLLAVAIPVILSLLLSN